MEFKFKKVLSVMCAILIFVFVTVTPFFHIHTCHDVSCMVDSYHICHDIDCDVCSLFNKYQDLSIAIFLSFIFLNLSSLKRLQFDLKKNVGRFLYNSLVKQKIKLTN